MTSENKENAKEQLNRDELFKLYEIALEETRHCSQISIQLWAAAPAVLALFGILAFNSRDALLDALCDTGSWLLVSSVGSLFAAVILSVINLYDEATDISRDVASEIGDRLSGQDSRDISCLFITVRTGHLFPTWALRFHVWWQPFKLLWRRGGIIILFLFLVIWWLLWWWVFHYSGTFA